MQNESSLIDSFGRQITYLRMSVTDRCDFRCVYCMAEKPTFLPRAKLLSLEELETIAQAFIELGVSKIRITGGEPLVRKNIVEFFTNIAKLDGLKELAMTTNGSQLYRMAEQIHSAGMTRLNVSLDTLDEKKFKQITRTGDLNQVLTGIQTATKLDGLKVKLNAVIMRGKNDNEIIDLVNYAIKNGLDISFIEEMPLGEVTEHDRQKTYFSSDEVRAVIESHYSLIPSTESTGGPSRYYRVNGYADSKIGFISPHSHNFCGDCNRVRLTAEGRLLLCLGNEDSVDLRAILRRYPGETERLKSAIVNGLSHKPKEHHFTTDNDVYILRFMNMTGG